MPPIYPETIISNELLLEESLLHAEFPFLWRDDIDLLSGNIHLILAYDYSHHNDDQHFS